VGRVGLKAVVYFEVMTTIALGIGLVLAWLTRPGVGMNIDLRSLDASSLASYAKNAESLKDTAGYLMKIIPETAIDAFAKGDILQILVFAVLFGSALSLLGDKAQRVNSLIEELSHVFFRIIGFIIKLAPLGVLGATGTGIREHCGVAPDQVDMWMGTMSKTLAGCGGFIAGCQPLVDMLRHLAPGFLYSVGLAPTLAEASLAALERLQAEPARVAQLQARGRQFLTEARAAGLNTGTSAGYAVVPVITGSSLKAAQWANAMFDEGINVQPIFYPAVEEKAARLRFFICSTHEPEQISRTVAVLSRLAGRGA
ncbi:aminotransferase class I/II-fold pyridoxal phosphate-dependent enzyme, partial [Escherichia coli]|uniref:cation:dicarboxylate symporter family transporter n=1 Tax=Escherichia coli TaxID=562 RepID=UPI00128AEB8F